MRHKTYIKGFTLIELLIVIAVAILLTVLAAPFYARFFTQDAVLVTNDEIINSLRKAQLYSMMGKQNGSWGVSYSSNSHQVTLFLQGNSAFNETYSVNTNITVNGMTQITFAHTTGLPTPTGPTTVTTSGDNNSKSFTLNSQGVISKNN